MCLEMAIIQEEDLENLCILLKTITDLIRQDNLIFALIQFRFDIPVNSSGKLWFRTAINDHKSPLLGNGRCFQPLRDMNGMVHGFGVLSFKTCHQELMNERKVYTIVPHQRKWKFLLLNFPLKLEE